MIWVTVPKWYECLVPGLGCIEAEGCARSKYFSSVFSAGQRVGWILLAPLVATSYPTPVIRGDHVWPIHGHVWAHVWSPMGPYVTMYGPYVVMYGPIRDQVWAHTWPRMGPYVTTYGPIRDHVWTHTWQRMGPYMVTSDDSYIQGMAVPWHDSIAPVRLEVPAAGAYRQVHKCRHTVYEEEQSQGYNRRTMCSFTNFSSN